MPGAFSVSPQRGYDEIRQVRRGFGYTQGSLSGRLTAKLTLGPPRIIAQVQAITDRTSGSAAGRAETSPPDFEAGLGAQLAATTRASGW